MKKELNLHKKDIKISDQGVNELQENELEHVSGGAWGDEKSESSVNDWESATGTTSTLIMDAAFQWVQDDQEGKSTSAWYGLENNP